MQALRRVQRAIAFLLASCRNRRPNRHHREAMRWLTVACLQAVDLLVGGIFGYRIGPELTMWKFEILALILGGFLIVVAILGGGFELKELRIPTVDNKLRVVAGFLGLFFVVIAVAAHAELFDFIEETEAREIEVVERVEDPLEKVENWTVGPGKLKRTVRTTRRYCEKREDWYWRDVPVGHACEGPETVVELTRYGNQVVQLRGRYTDSGVYERERRRLVDAFGEPEMLPNFPNACGWTIDEDHFVRLDLLPNGDPYLIVSATDSGKDFGSSRRRVAPPPEFQGPPPAALPDRGEATQPRQGQE